METNVLPDRFIRTFNMEIMKMHEENNHLIKSFNSKLEAMRPGLMTVLPKNVGIEKFLTGVTSCIKQNPKLQDCDMKSVLRAAFTAAYFGLELEKAFGQCFILPLRNVAQFIVGYKGYITLAARNGISIRTSVIREKDHFVYHEGLEPKLEHHIKLNDRGDIVGAYAIAEKPNMKQIIKVLSVDEIRERISRGDDRKLNSGPWRTDFKAMCEKTSIRALGNHLPGKINELSVFDAIASDGKNVYVDYDGNLVHNDNVINKKTNEQPELLQNYESNIPDNEVLLEQ